MFAILFNNPVKVILLKYAISGIMFLLGIVFAPIQFKNMLATFYLYLSFIMCGYFTGRSGLTSYEIIILLAGAVFIKILTIKLERHRW